MKAYIVRERFEGYKEQLVFAHTGDEAKEKCRMGQIVECLEDDGPHPAGIGSVRREPQMDPLASVGASEETDQ